VTFSLVHRVASLLADPAMASRSLAADLADVRLDDAQVDEALDILKHNKVPLLAIHKDQGAAQTWFLAQSAVIAARDAEEKRCQGLLDEYLAMQALWRKAGIDDIVIKSSGKAPSFPYMTSNLDLLVHRADGDRARAILRHNGYVELRNVEENAKYLFRLFRGGREVSGLHIHEHMGWYSSFADEERMLAGAHAAPDDESYLIPSDEDILLTTASHFYYEDKEVKLSDLATIQRCAGEPDLDWDHVFEVAALRGWVDGLRFILLLCADVSRRAYGHTTVPQTVLDACSRGMSARSTQLLERYLARAREKWPVRIPFWLSKRFFYGRLWHDPQKGARARAADLIMHTLHGIKLRLHLHSQPSMLIALCGADGSGKTTQADLLVAAFDGCHIRAQRVWSRGGSSRFIQLFTQLARRGSSDATGPSDGTDDASVARRRAMLSKPLMRAAWGWLVAIELAAIYARRLRWPLLRGKVIICDRYVLDTWADWAAYSGLGADSAKAGYARFLRWIAPRPDLQILMDLPAEESHARSTSAPPLEFMREQRDAYLALNETMGGETVDAAQDVVKIADDLAHRALTTYFDSYHTLVNALFFRNPRSMPDGYAAD
jgi:thymidylate kinase